MEWKQTMNAKLLIVLLFFVLPNVSHAQKTTHKLRVLKGPFHSLSTRVALVETPMNFDTTSEFHDIPINSLVGINCKTKKILDFGYRISDSVSLVYGEFKEHQNAQHLFKLLNPLCKSNSQVFTDQMSLEVFADSYFYTFYPETLKKSNNSYYSVWLKKIEYEQVPMLDSNKKPMTNVNTGEIIKRRIQKPNSRDEKQKIIFKCETPSIGISSYIKYSESGNVTESETDNNVQTYEVVPDSIGESVVNKLCLLK